MPFAKVYWGLTGVAGRALIIGACGIVLAGCDTLSSINPFDKSETYKPEIVADVPAEQMYKDRKSTRLNSSHANISYAVFCLKKKTDTPSTSRSSLPCYPLSSR